MSEVFRGASTHSLDDKQRLIVPKRFLERLPAVDTNFVLTASQDKCLLLISKSAFDQKASNFDVDPLAEEAEERAKLRRFLGHAEDCKPDKAGRIVISEFLRNYMGLGKDDKRVVVVGMGPMIELWSALRWQESMEDAGTETSSLPDETTVGSKGASKS